MIEKISLQQRFLWISNTIFHQVLAVVSVFILWTIFYNFEKDSLFTYHMGLTCLGYIPLMAEGVVLFSPHNLWSKNMERSTKKRIHISILILTFLLITTGISLMISEKKSRHFQSTHAWTGFVSWILILTTQFFGWFVLKFNRLNSVYFKFIHNLLGLSGFVFGVVSLGYGVCKHSFRGVSSNEAIVGVVILLGLIGVWVVLGAAQTLVSQFKAIVMKK